jgi:hypothetical protein
LQKPSSIVTLVPSLIAETIHLSAALLNFDVCQFGFDLHRGRQASNEIGGLGGIVHQLVDDL